MSSSSPAIRRIMREWKDWQENPSDVLIAAPVEDNLFEWHFTICGSKDTEFEGGRYHGKFILPSQYPFKAPDVIMLTKSGRFEIGKKICLSFSGYHHELWQPAWTIRSMLTALRAFMESKAEGIGAMSVNKAQRRKYARMSNRFTCSKCGVTMKDIQFPVMDSDAAKQRDTNGRERSSSSGDTTSSVTEPSVTTASATTPTPSPSKPVKEPTPTPNPSVPTSSDTDTAQQNDVVAEHGNESNDGVNVAAANMERAVNDADIAADPSVNGNGNVLNGNDGQDHNAVIVQRSPRNDGNEQDTKMLDSFTIILVVMILGILMKKFAVTVIDQL